MSDSLVELYRSGHSIKTIAKLAGLSFYKVRRQLIDAGIMLRAQSNFRDLTNIQFGNWIVLRRWLGCEDGTTRWVCRCNCGAEKILQGTSLVFGTTKKCRLCEGKRKREEAGPIPDSLWNRIVRQAKCRGIPFEITREQAYLMFQLQQGRCALTGWVLVLPKDGRTASLDRKDSSIGYQLDNIQWVHKDVNRMKWELTNERFREVCQAVVNQEKNNVGSTTLSPVRQVA